MTSIVPPRGQWTADILSSLPDDRHRAEVIDGQLHLVYGNDSSHDLATWSLSMIVAPFAWAYNFEFTLGPKPLRFSAVSQVQPDLVVVPRWQNHPSHYSETPTGPELIVEVVTPFTRQVDMGIKQRLYAASEVHAYWAVDYVAREVLVWRGSNWRREVETKTLVWEPRRSERALTIDLQAYFNALPDFDFSFTQSDRWIRRIQDGVARGEVSTSYFDESEADGGV